ncbi:MAG: tetratricopeptide repeat protein [Nitrospirae bacterium]|nr:tetratricopeptide repeat protein [Nitrospirota bacterium]
MYIKFRIHDTKKIHDAGYTIHDKENHTACIMDRGSCIVSRASCIMYLASLFSAVLAMVTKEISFTLPFIIIFYEFCFLSKPLVWQPQVGRSLYLIPFLLILIIIPLNFILHSEMIDTYGTDAVEELRMLQLEDLTTHSKYEYLLTQFRAISTYIRLLFFPINQNLDYDYPIHNSFFEPQVVLSFLFLLSIFGLGVHLFYRSRFTMHDAQCTMHGSRVTNHGLRLISFGILWFFITLSVESSIIPIKDVIFEHRLYLPSIGAFIAINIGLFIFVEKLKQRWKRAGVTVIIIFAVGVIILTGAAYTRNIVWKDKLSLWSDVVRKSPEKERGYNGLANAYSNRGWDDKAIEYYQTAILLKPDSPISHYNLGMAYEKKGLIDKAITEYQSAIILNQGFVNAHNNLGLVYFKKGWTDKAIEHYQIALRLNPDDAETHNNLGTAYSSKDLTEKAAEHYRIALKLKPYYPVAHFNLGLIHLKNNDLDEARKEFESTLRIKPDHHQARQFLNYVYNLERPLTTR